MRKMTLLFKKQQKAFSEDKSYLAWVRAHGYPNMLNRENSSRPTTTNAEPKKRKGMEPTRITCYRSDKLFWKRDKYQKDWVCDFRMKSQIKNCACLNEKPDLIFTKVELKSVLCYELDNFLISLDRFNKYIIKMSIICYKLLKS